MTTAPHDTADIRKLGRRLARLEADAAKVREELLPHLITAYQDDHRSVADIAADASMKRATVLAWLKRAGVTLDRGPGNRFTSGRRQDGAA